MPAIRSREVIKVLVQRLGTPFLLLGLLLTNEWLFLSTKLSFLSSFSMMEKVWIWIVALTAVLLVMSLIVLLLGMTLENIIPGGSFIFRLIISLSTSFLLTLLTLLMIDNFTYTIFDVGLKVLVLSQRRILSFLIFLFFIAVFRHNWAKQNHRVLFSFANKRNGRLAGSVALVILVIAGITITHSLRPHNLINDENSPEVFRPNIVIIGVDAVESAHMSVYGYDLNTTPFLLEKRNEFLLAENSFTNTTASFGAIGALLSGKYPTTTRLYFAPEVMWGKNRYEHFPGLLRKVGYQSLDMSLRWYTDPKDMNLLNAFDEANFRSIYPCVGGLGFDFFCANFPKPVLLIEQIFDRVLEKLALINPLSTSQVTNNSNYATAAPRYPTHLDYTQLVRVGQPEHYYHEDDARIEKAIEFISRSEGPFFINLHMMSTHGPTYVSGENHFSRGLRQTSKWQSEFYNDAILRMDASIQEIYEFLESTNLLTNTIVVISSDHGRNHNPRVRLPLMFRFPDSIHHGVVSSNSSRIDVAPTLLDYMDWEIPKWMEGISLIKTESTSLLDRPIFSAIPATMNTQSGDQLAQYQPAPPFFSLGGMEVIKCNQVFGWSFASNKWEMVTIDGHTMPCKESEFSSPEEFQTLIKQHLMNRGYETTSLENPQQAE
jgi:arylsulfatase A-like enzyme